jgi:hypothetical protein
VLSQPRKLWGHRLYVAALRLESGDLLIVVSNRQAKQAISDYGKRWSIEPMFRDFKSGGYCMEATQANDERFLALVLLIAMAYTIASERGQRIRCKGIAKYIGRVKEPKRVQRRHSDFWLGLYGSLWVESMQIWGEWAEQLMALKPQKRPFYLRGLRAMSLMQSAF